MPLPRTKVDFSYLDHNSSIKTATLERKETGYRPDEEYHPTMRLVKCSKCGEVGVCEFKGGLNLKEGDRLMAGRPINGACLHCGKRTEMVPLPVHLQNEPKVRLYYQIQEALTEAVKRGEQLSPSGMIWPLARVREWERMKRGESQPAGA